ncbi:MAG TPA: sulfate adenylyltransferase subunit CysN [Bacteroidales bacterium]|nr:sulfate adenylyltransferase subunit CysN [Bacteroidales bacterium]HNS47709.1 sulfate adenylyltransferase subunit CysN [Bacteroidales bacterium]
MEEKFSSKGYLDMQLLRFTTAGSVDDGKSTLIGRLLYDSKSIFEDQLEAVKRASIRRGNERVDLALLTDGLRAEREQGITIDVAYRYFATPKRKFIIADTPGHVQYTRNMVTGASTANAAIILIDARNGVTEQTFRHSYIASLLEIQHLIICINKMDLVEFKQEVYENIKNEFIEFSKKLEPRDIRFVPLSALLGDNVVEPSAHMDWYEGGTLMHTLETIDIASDYNMTDPRFPVQYVIRPQSDDHPDYRGYAGRVDGGIFRKGDKIMVLPQQQITTIESIDFYDKELDAAYPPMSVTMRIKDDIDISRGDLFAREDNLPSITQDINAMVCWMSERPLQLNGKYAVKHTTKDVRCIVKNVLYKVNVNNLSKNHEDKNLTLNEIACVSLRTTQPLLIDPYKRNRKTGSLILIDEGTNNTVGVGMVTD